MPGLDQGWHRPGDGIEVVAVADLYQRTEHGNAELQSADALVLRRGLSRRYRRLHHARPLDVLSPCAGCSHGREAPTSMSQNQTSRSMVDEAGTREARTRAPRSAYRSAAWTNRRR